MSIRWISLAVLGLCALPAMAQDQVIFDTLTGVSGTIESNPGQSSAPLTFLNGASDTINPNLALDPTRTGRTYTGQTFFPSVPGNVTSPVTITKLDIVMYSAAAVNYSGGVQLRMQFWDNYSFADSGDPANPTSLVFSAANAGVQTVNLGALTTAADTLYFFSVALPTPVVLPASAFVVGSGVAFNFQGDTGSGFQTTSDLGTAVRGGNINGNIAPALAVGSNPLGGYYRNFNGREDFNFIHKPIATPFLGDNRAITSIPAPPGNLNTRSALGIRLYAAAAAPEPASGLLLLLALPIVKRRQHSR